MQSTLFKSLLAASEIAKSEKVRAPACAKPRCAPGGREWDCHIPEDGAVFSPDVHVFRGSTFDGYPFLDAPVALRAVVSVAMPNCNSQVRDAPVDKPADAETYERVLVKKFNAMLAASLAGGADVLVVPDLGCGVYKNDPAEIGHALGMALRQPGIGERFREIHLVGSQEFARAAERAGKLGQQALQKTSFDPPSRAAAQTAAKARNNTPPPAPPREACHWPLHVTVVRAEGLRNADWGPGNLSDPYCICRVPGKPRIAFKTPVIKNNLNPVWNYKGEIGDYSVGDMLSFEVWDKDWGKEDDFLGKATLACECFYPDGFDGMLVLDEQAASGKQQAASGQLLVEITTVQHC